MKRIVAVLILVLVVLGTSHVQAEGWTAEATSPDGAHTLYADYDGVALVDNATGGIIPIRLTGVFHMEWMDNKSALLVRPFETLAVDLQGTLFYLGNNQRTPDCIAPPDATYQALAANSSIFIWAYPTEAHLIVCGGNKHITVYDAVNAVYITGNFACWVTDRYTQCLDPITGAHP